MKSSLLLSGKDQSSNVSCLLEAVALYDSQFRAFTAPWNYSWLLLHPATSIFKICSYLK